MNTLLGPDQRDVRIPPAATHHDRFQKGLPERPAEEVVAGVRGEGVDRADPRLFNFEWDLTTRPPWGFAAVNISQSSLRV